MKKHFATLFMTTLLSGVLIGTGWAKEFDKKGPAEISLGNNLATLKLPAGFGYINAEHTRQMLKANANDDPGTLGVVEPLAKDAGYEIHLAFRDQGYVEDNDADKLNPDEILKSYQEGTESMNEQRKKSGIPAFHVTAWETTPNYDKSKHVVVWSMLAKEDGSPDPFVNYNTRLLGRKGVLEVNLICDLKNLPASKAPLAKILDSVSYNQGERYQDYQKGDRVSAGGIAALVLGGAALKKLGVLGFLGAFFKPLLLAGKKFIIFIVAGVAAIFNRLTGRSKKSEDA